MKGLTQGEANAKRLTSHSSYTQEWPTDNPQLQHTFVFVASLASGNTEKSMESDDTKAPNEFDFLQPIHLHNGVGDLLAHCWMGWRGPSGWNGTI
jgi:hypothetical protein